MDNFLSSFFTFVSKHHGMGTMECIYRTNTHTFFPGAPEKTVWPASLVAWTRHNCSTIEYFHMVGIPSGLVFLLNLWKVMFVCFPKRKTSHLLGVEFWGCFFSQQYVGQKGPCVKIKVGTRLSCFICWSQCFSPTSWEMWGISPRVLFTSFLPLLH